MDNYKTLLKEVLKEIDLKYFERNERDFSYELYHDLRNNFTDSVELTAETPKNASLVTDELLQNAFFRSYFYSKNNFSLETNTFKKSPDLLIHEYATRKQQFIAIEIKPLKKSIALILTDVTKLMFYIKGQLKYKSGVMILFAENFNEGKVIQIQNTISNSLLTFPEIEIWIATPKKVNIIWCNGSAQNPTIEIE